MRSERKCPACGEALAIERRLGGLVARLPNNCHACGLRLMYDTAGGVYVVSSDEEAGEGQASGD